MAPCLLPVLLRFFVFVFEFLVITFFQLWYSAVDSADYCQLLSAL